MLDVVSSPLVPVLYKDASHASHAFVGSVLGSACWVLPLDLPRLGSVSGLPLGSAWQGPFSVGGAVCPCVTAVLRSVL